MHASVDCPCVGEFDGVIEKMNVAEFSPTNNPYSNTYNYGWRNHPNFSWRSQNVENPQAQSSKLISPVCKTRDMLLLLVI